MHSEMSTPGWLTAISWLFVAVALGSAAFIAYDLLGRGRRLRTGAMSPLWPITALYFGPLAVWAYLREGARSKTGFSAEAFTAGAPGGAASLIGHLIGVPLVVTGGLTIAGLDLWPMIAAIALIATALLFAYEFFVATVPERRLAPGRGAVVAAFIALATVLAFDVGMGGWMLFLHFGWIMPSVTEVSFLFLMQIGLVLGFLTGYPMVRLLVGRGVKAGGVASP